MLGSYFSSSGQPIRQGAAGLGEYVGGGGMPWAGAYQDGSLGRSEGGLRYGPPRSYQDGSLGEYFTGAAGLGATYEQAAAGISGFGCSACGQVPAGPLMARHDGVLGAIDDALGANTLDLQNPAALKEMKAAMGLFLPEMAAVTTPANDPTVGTSYFDDAFYNSPIWDVKADKLWWGCQTKLLAMPNSLYKAPSDITSTKGTHNWPKAAGVVAVSMLGAGSPSMGAGYFKQNFPILYAYNQAVQAAGGKLSGFKVTEPFFTQAEVVKGKGFSFAGIGAGALLGLGAIAAVGGFLLLRKK